MQKPDLCGDFLRAIARSYREEVGPARAEQLVSRAMARAGARHGRSRAIGALVASCALAASALTVGIIVLVGDSDAGPSPDPVTPVAAAPVAELPPSGAEAVTASTLPTAELLQALNLIEQQRQMEAAEVVVRALASVAVTVADPKVPETVTSTTVSGEQQTRSDPSPTVGAVPPEQATHPQTGATTVEQDSEDLSADPGSTTTSEPQPSIEELGEVLKVEVEELLSADLNELAEAAENARDAAQQIQDFGGEPTILLPSDGNNGE